MDFMGPFTFNGVTFLLGAATLIPVVLLFDRGRLNRAELKRLLGCGTICGLILFGAGSFQQFGVELTNSAGKSGFITGLYIIIVPIAGIFMKRRATLFTWAGAAFAVAGMYFLCVPDGFGGITRGDAMLFFGAFFWAAHIIAIDKFVSKVSSLKLSLTQFVVCGLISMICAFATETVRPDLLLLGAAPLLYRGVMSISVAYTLQIIGQRRVAPAKAAIIFSLESVFSAIGGAILIREVMSGRGYFGCALIFAGILFAQIPGRKKAARR
jgi:drug/metabolite transporter (DMT)-like permease